MSDPDKLYCKKVRVVREATESYVTLCCPHTLSFTCWKGMVEEMCGGHWTIHCYSEGKHHYFPKDGRRETDQN